MGEYLGVEVSSSFTRVAVSVSDRGYVYEDVSAIGGKVHNIIVHSS